MSASAASLIKTYCHAFRGKVIFVFIPGKCRMRQLAFSPKKTSIFECALLLLPDQVPAVFLKLPCTHFEEKSTVCSFACMIENKKK